MTKNIEIFQANLQGTDLRIGVVQARFNEPVCTVLREACLSELIALGVADDDIFVCTVPGALEIATALDALARTGEFHALIAIGAVIRGETYHFEVVSNQSADGVQRVSLEYGIPIANAVLTTNSDAQAEERALVKGREAAQVAVEMANLMDSITSLADDEGAV
jgi:6,7-dimethyl-8-ribityllumazine synthase